MACHQKKAVDGGASLVFSDESGFLLLPLVRRTLAPRGQAEPLVHRARQRDKVSVAAALTLSPCQGHVSLHYQTYPDGYVNVEVYARFIRRLLWRTDRPIVLVHDRGNMHRGDPVRELMSDFPRRLDLHLLPPYAPELNPVEQLWNFAKDKELSNFVPHDIAEANEGVTKVMDRIRHDQHRLRSFYRATPLAWDPLTVFF
jgi:putative transposase